jgi:fumarylacetoacetase
MSNQTQASWVPVSPDSDFPIQNLPYGIAQLPGRRGAVMATIIGDQVVDLAALLKVGAFDGIALPATVFKQNTLNAFIGLGRDLTAATRARLSACLSAVESSFSLLARRHADHILVPVSQAHMLMPLQVGDYTDFYSSREHATNVGMMFRDPAHALLPNWLHLPVGYHGRSSSIVVSDTPIRRPAGQYLPAGADQPAFGPSQRMDFELEMAFVIGKPTNLGQTICVDEAADYMFGMVLFNDWSARDLQQWEYVPLGPFLGKNFGSTISPWIVTMDALEPYRVAAPVQDPAPLPYLVERNRFTLDIQLEVTLSASGLAPQCISRSNFKYLYWTMAQQLAHHTVNGCNMRVGDLLASGTISGPAEDSLGSMLEICWKGTRPITLADGSTRVFLHDGDTLTLTGVCSQTGLPRIGFGLCSGTITPHEYSS